MTKRFRLLLASLMFVLGFFALSDGGALTAQAQEEEISFAATGHSVRGSFLRYWQERGGLRIFGYPISAEFAQDGRSTQYFERAVFQRFPEHAGTANEVQLLLLGRLLTAERENELPFQPAAMTSGTRFFPETGHNVGGRFLAYWQNTGGLPTFGYPIAEPFEERNPADGQIYLVQYFERARFEYHPELGQAGNDVQLGLLGAQYAAIRGVPSAGEAGGGLVQITQLAPVVVNNSFISPLVELYGEVAVGKGVFIAGNTVIRADAGGRICIGSETNIQDNVLFLALAGTPVSASECGTLASSTHERVSIAHQAVIRNSQIGNFTFVGFHAQLQNVILEDGAFVLHGARLSNVRIGANRLVPIGAVITTQAQADALPLKGEGEAQFQEDVLEVNREFAEHYPDLFEQGGVAAVSGVSAAPKTSFNSGASPTIGQNVQLEPFARIVGDVRLGDNSVVGRRTSIRADEGTPIIIGANAEIEDRVTFHALKGTSITIGRNLDTDDNIVFHGPLQVGDNLTIGDDAILFRSTVGNNVTIGSRAIVVGVTLRNGVTVPDDALITTQAQADALE